MPIDTSMYAHLQPANQGMQTLGSMIDMANGIQRNQALQNQNVQTGIDAREMQNLQPVLRDVNSYTDDKGNIDFNKLTPMVMSIAPKNGGSVLSNMAQSQQQRTLAQNAIQGQSYDALTRSANAIKSLDPEKTTIEDLQQTAQALNQNFSAPNAQAATNQVFSNLSKVFSSTKPGDPLRATALQHASMMYLPIETQQKINTPTGVEVDNGQQSWVANTKFGVDGLPIGAILPGTYQQKQLPPTTPKMGPNNTMGYLGPQTAAMSPTGQQQPAGFVPSGLPAGSAKNIDNNVDAMNTHFGSLQDQAQGNQLVQSLRGNIQSLAQKAITGTLSDKLAYYNGLLAALPDHGHADDIKTATDLLDKSMTQLNLSTPASTDAARTLITLARPNGTMTADAIKKATDQVASQVEANMAIRNHLSGYKYANNGQGNPTGYQQERQNIEKVADPRIWQWLDLKPGSPEATKFMTDQPDAPALLKKLLTLKHMGVINE